MSLSATSSDGYHSATKPLSHKFDPLADRFLGFEHQLHERKQKKQDDAERKIQELQKQIDDLQTTIALEKSNQATAMKAMQSWLSATIEQYAAKFGRPYEVKFEELHKRADDIVAITQALDQRITKETAGLPALIDERAKELLTEITDFKKRFEVAQLAREEKEAALLVRVVEQDARLNRQLEAERSLRDARTKALSDEIATEVNFRAKGYDSIRQSLHEQVAALKTSIEREEQARKETDEELVLAVKHYAAALQDSIKIVADS